MMQTGYFRFNGAALFQVRKDAQGLPTLALLFSFNGAALFQVRKAKEILECNDYLVDASMGPHSFKCGKNKRRLAD